VGAMLVDRFVSRDDVEKVMIVDKDALPESLKTHINKDKIEFLQANVADIVWQDPAALFGPEVVIHTAWHIREMYANKNLQYVWNVNGSESVFDFAFNFPSVKKIIHFSSIACYGAYSDNTPDRFFTEDDGLRPMDFLYSEEKRLVEISLIEKYKQAKTRGVNGHLLHVPQVVIIRPASITGPQAFKVKKGINLQSFITSFMPFIPVTPHWLRQFVHEKDIVSITELFCLKKDMPEVEIINACPPGSPILGVDIAKIVGKKPLTLYPWMVRVLFFFGRHLTWGHIPTSKGGWKSYSYPIPVDGSKVTKLYGFSYKFTSLEAFIDARK